ncbi:hypothetical protein FACS1894184_01850 [Clostridia bacterium]|nr:hypothetical protein FACS1894184_01850 [Clostridia bacterium]
MTNASFNINHTSHPLLYTVRCTVWIEQQPSVNTSMAYGLFVLQNYYQAARGVALRGLLQFVDVEPGEYMIRPERSLVRQGHGAEAILRVAADGQTYIDPSSCKGPQMYVIHSCINYKPNPQPYDGFQRIDLAAMERNFLASRRKFFAGANNTGAQSRCAKPLAQS